MTQEEFYLKAILAMASNPKYTEMILDEDDPNVTFPVLQVDQILEDADILLKQTQNMWMEAFDGAGIEDIHDRLGDIRKQLEDIHSYGLAVHANILEE